MLMLPLVKSKMLKEADRVDSTALMCTEKSSLWCSVLSFGVDHCKNAFPPATHSSRGPWFKVQLFGVVLNMGEVFTCQNGPK